MSAVTPKRDYKRKRRAKPKPSARGGWHQGWIVALLGWGDPLPSVVERVIRRSGASIAGSGSWPTWTRDTISRMGRCGPGTPPRKRRWTRTDWHLSTVWRCWWRVRATRSQHRAIAFELRRLGVRGPW